jgi:LysM repeat protein
MKRKQGKNRLSKTNKKKSTLKLKIVSIKNNDRVDYYREIKNLLSKKMAYFFLGLVTTFAFIFVLIQVLFPILKTRQSEVILKKNQKTSKNSDAIVYRVKRGDTLWSIAEKFYGSGFDMDKIVKANKLDSNASVEVGQQLIIPKITPSTGQKGQTSSLQTNNHSYYIVKEGDFLWKIAEEVYGDGSYWTKIIQANQIADPSILIPGTKLIIPR